MINEEAGVLSPRRSQERIRGGPRQHLQIELFPGALQAVRMQSDIDQLYTIFTLPRQSGQKSIKIKLDNTGPMQSCASRIRIDTDIFLQLDIFSFKSESYSKS